MSSELLVAQTALDNTIRSVQSTVQTALDSADSILGVSQIHEHDNDTFEAQLGALAPQTKTDAQNALQSLYSLATNGAETESTANTPTTASGQSSSKVTAVMPIK